ncbi:hypothetical protein GMLC_02000 [Geomonas limicola]|uniref:Lipoprotein n=1 Tax=Geomonas limicola TaxID=2740186 RepID=A0A6V8N2I1_9BACT|nr:hypothetical protein [Geomonas limicola]GFO66621.1 hypothetical protein GMLC_02000 [Geomonas limicola]
MKSSTKGRAILVFLLTALVAGCAGTGASRNTSSPYGSATLQGISDDYLWALHQTQATEEALLGITLAAPPDLRQAFRFYLANAELMIQAGDHLLHHADGMFYRGTFYLVESGRSLEACALPRTGRNDEQRVIDLGDDFDRVSEAGGEIKRAYRAFQFDVVQLRDVLDNNLTLAMVDELDPIFEKAQVDSTSLQEALERGLGVLEETQATLARRQALPASPLPMPLVPQR